METSSLTWQFQIVKTDTTHVAEGEMVSAKVDSIGKSTRLTDSERAKLLTKSCTQISEY